MTIAVSAKGSRRRRLMSAAAVLVAAVTVAGGVRVALGALPSTGERLGSGSSPSPQARPGDAQAGGGVDGPGSGPSIEERSRARWSGVQGAGQVLPKSAARDLATSDSPETPSSDVVVRIPALGLDWSRRLTDGIGTAQLRNGLGHVPTTAEPGAVGNCVVAGHRSGVADPPFRDIDAIRVGSSVVIEGAGRVWTYRVTGREIVEPSATSVLAAVPGHPELTTQHAVLTLLTCWPAAGHAKRVAIYATLAATAITT
jgi:sortase A